MTVHTGWERAVELRHFVDERADERGGHDQSGEFGRPDDRHAIVARLVSLAGVEAEEEPRLRGRRRRPHPRSTRIDTAGA